MSNENLVGGTESDRKRILEKHQEYLVENGRFGWQKLRDEIFSASADAVFFNSNGHTYKGRDQWVKLWQYYVKQFETNTWQTSELSGLVSGDVAVVWCHRMGKLRRIGTGVKPGHMPEAEDYPSRSTMVFKKEGGDWRVFHVHFSHASKEPRPGGV